MLDLDPIRAKFFEPTGVDMPLNGMYKPSANEVAFAANGVKVASFVGGSGGGSPRLIHSGNVAPLVNTDGTDATPVITETYICEIQIPVAMLVTGIAHFNGSVASGNIKLGLFSGAGALLASTASTLMVGTDAYQRVPFTTPYQAAPGKYLVALQVDNTTARVNAHTFGNFGASKKTGEVYGTWTTLTPPTTFTTALGPIASLY